MTRRIAILIPSLTILALAVFYTPLSKSLITASHGSVAQTPFSSLSLRDPAIVQTGIQVGHPVPVVIANHTPNSAAYNWTASQGSRLRAHGIAYASPGAHAFINVPTSSSTAGTLTIVISRSKVFITVPLTPAPKPKPKPTPKPTPTTKPASSTPSSSTPSSTTTSSSTPTTPTTPTTPITAKPAS